MELVTLFALFIIMHALLERRGLPAALSSLKPFRLLLAAMGIMLGFIVTGILVASVLPTAGFMIAAGGTLACGSIIVYRYRLFFAAF